MKRHLKNLARRSMPGLFVVLTVVQADAAELYVAPDGRDSNPGTVDLPFQTIARAADAATPGTTVQVAPGVYREILKTSASGTATARIRYVSSVKWGAKIRTEGPDDHWSWTNRGSYVDIEGFDVSNNGSGGIDNFGSHVQIAKNHVHNIPAPGCPSDGGAGIDAAEYTAVETSFIGNVVHDIGEFPIPCPRVHGIYHSHEGGWIVNNIAFRNSGWGIHLWHAPFDLYDRQQPRVQQCQRWHRRGGRGRSVLRRSEQARRLYHRDQQYRLRQRERGHRRIRHDGPEQPLLKQPRIRKRGGLGANNGLTHAGTVAAPPAFVQYDPNGKGNYHLTVDSPAIDRGRWIRGPDD